MIDFPVSGVHTYWWLPMVVAFGISCFTSMGGLSGAFLILPFQISVLGFTGPAVSATNLVYNVVSTPSGIYQYYHEKRMVWPLAWTIVNGTLPGVFLGAIIRIKLLPDPAAFKLFAGFVLLYVAVRLCVNIFRGKDEASAMNSSSGKFEVDVLEVNVRRIGYSFEGQNYYASSIGLFAVSFIVGVVGGTYGIGGGAIIAPFLVAIFGLPVYTIAGAALMGTFLTSFAGVVFYWTMAHFYAETGLAIAPDWHLGAQFGIGGMIGIYVGARLQKYMPERFIKVIIALCLLFVSGKYVIGFFLK